MEPNTQAVMSWGDRFALIDHFKPTDEIICETFHIQIDELVAARTLRQNGSFKATSGIDPTLFVGLFEETIINAPVVRQDNDSDVLAKQLQEVINTAAQEDVTPKPSLTPGTGKRGRKPGERRALVDKLFLDNHATLYRSQIVKLVQEQFEVTPTHASIYVNGCEKRLGLVAKRGRAPKA